MVVGSKVRNLSEARAAARMTQSRLAAAACLSEKTVARAEAGGTVSSETANALASVLPGLSITSVSEEGGEASGSPTPTARDEGRLRRAHRAIDDWGYSLIPHERIRVVTAAVALTSVAVAVLLATLAASDIGGGNEFLFRILVRSTAFSAAVGAAVAVAWIHVPKEGRPSGRLATYLLTSTMAVCTLGIASVTSGFLDWEREGQAFERVQVAFRDAMAAVSEREVAVPDYDGARDRFRALRALSEGTRLVSPHYVTFDSFRKAWDCDRNLGDSEAPTADIRGCDVSAPPSWTVDRRHPFDRAKATLDALSPSGSAPPPAMPPALAARNVRDYRVATALMEALPKIPAVHAVVDEERNPLGSPDVPARP